jgi:anti-sigma B factor antagonist
MDELPMSGITISRDVTGYGSGGISFRVWSLQRAPIQNTLRHGFNHMNYTIAAKEGTSFISIEGTLDALSVSELRGELDKLIGTRPKSVEVDLSQLRMIDSSGVGALVSLYKRVRANGGDVVLKGVRDQPLAIFQLLQLDRLMLRAGKTPPPSRAIR